MHSNLANAPTPPASSIALLSSSMRRDYHYCDSLVNTNVRSSYGTTCAMDKLRSRLVYARDLRGLSQTALAKLAGVSQGTIGNIEAGLRDGASSLASIAHALNVRYFWLRDGDGTIEQHTYSPDAQAIAEAFDALPTDTVEAINRRAWLYASIIGSIANHAATPASAPAQQLAAAPIGGRLQAEKTRL